MSVCFFNTNGYDGDRDKWLQYHMDDNQTCNLGVLKDVPPTIVSEYSTYCDGSITLPTCGYLDKNSDWNTSPFYAFTHQDSGRHDITFLDEFSLKEIWNNLADGWHVFSVIFTYGYAGIGDVYNLIFAKNIQKGAAPDELQAWYDVSEATKCHSRVAITPESKNFGTQNNNLKITATVSGGWLTHGKDSTYKMALYIDRELFDNNFVLEPDTPHELFITNEKWDSLSLGWHTYTLAAEDDDGNVGIANFVFSKGYTDAPAPPLDAPAPGHPGSVSSFFNGKVNSAKKSYLFDICATGKWSAMDYVDGVKHDSGNGSGTVRYTSDLSNIWDSLSCGTHTFHTVVTGENGIAYEQTWTFVRANYVAGVTGSFDTASRHVRYCVDGSGKWTADAFLNGAKLDSFSGTGSGCFEKDFSGEWDDMSGGNYIFRVVATGEDGSPVSGNIPFVRPSVPGFRPGSQSSGYRYNGSYGGGSTNAQSGYGWSSRWDSGSYSSADLGVCSSPPGISYSFNSDENYGITVRLDGRTIDTSLGHSGKYSGSINWGSVWGSLPPGRHTIEVTGTTDSGDVQTIIWNGDKPSPLHPDSARRIIPQSCDVGTLGQKRYYIVYRVYGGGTFSRTHKLDGGTRLTAENQEAGDYIYDERNASGTNTG